MTPPGPRIVLALGVVAAFVQPTDRGPRFELVERGIGFVHDNGRTPERRLPETMGAGVAWLDYDRDGALDLYFVQSGTVPGSERPGVEQPHNVAYRNRGDGSFAVARTGAEDAGYGMGVTAADYDGDGWSDLYVTNFRANVLYRNNGDGTFSRARAGVEDARWSSSAAWGDVDADGDLDLYVANYLAYDVATVSPCGDPTLDGYAYCHVDLFDGLTDALYRNEGDGTFTDVAVTAGVANAAEGKGLGVVFGDLDGDDRLDIYVANDTQQNFLYLNLGDGRFEDQGLFSGTGYSDEGRAQAGMGTDLADLDGDGSAEILVTNFAFENNNLYRAFAPGAYLDDAFALGIGEPGLPLLAFGIVAVDADGDGDREVVVANGHILDTVDELQDGTAYPQPNQLFVNRLAELRRERLATGDPVGGDDPWRPRSGLFELAPASGGFEPIEVSRGLAVGDAEGDGWPELLFTNSGAAPRLLHNLGGESSRLVIRLRARGGNREGLGARVVVTPLGADPSADGAAGFPQVYEVRSATSYLSQGATDLYVGLGASDQARIEVTWPGGAMTLHERVDAGSLLLLADDGGMVRRSLRR